MQLYRYYDNIILHTWSLKIKIYLESSNILDNNIRLMESLTLALIVWIDYYYNDKRNFIIQKYYLLINTRVYVHYYIISNIENYKKRNTKLNYYFFKLHINHIRKYLLKL